MFYAKQNCKELFTEQVSYLENRWIFSSYSLILRNGLITRLATIRDEIIDIFSVRRHENLRLRKVQTNNKNIKGKLMIT